MRHKTDFDKLLMVCTSPIIAGQVRLISFEGKSNDKVLSSLRLALSQSVGHFSWPEQVQDESRKIIFELSEEPGTFLTFTQHTSSSKVLSSKLVSSLGDLKTCLNFRKRDVDYSLVKGLSPKPSSSLYWASQSQITGLTSAFAQELFEKIVMRASLSKLV